jgi:hypothetical protein
LVDVIGDGIPGMPEKDACEGLEVDPEVGCSDIGKKPNVDRDKARVDLFGDVRRCEVVVECGFD